MKKKKVLFVLGTRPEALKMAPVIRHFKRQAYFQTYLCLTAQHREMSDQVLRLFNLHPDFDLDVMKPGQTLSELTQRIFGKMEEVFAKIHPDLILVQGDTTTSFVVALKAFYSHIAVGHIEAGLRTFNKYHPFPEEMNRLLITRLADYHFPPTASAALHLKNEGVPANKIFITGNTVVDALKQIRPQVRAAAPAFLKQLNPKLKIVLVTAHRRESFGAPMRSICQALRDLVNAVPDIQIVYPVHPNPHVQKVVFAELKSLERVHLLAPLSYTDFLVLMERAHLILTDSGGVQEEAPSFGKPVLVMREVSERNEGVKLGVAKLVGTSRSVIRNTALRLLKNPSAYRHMVSGKNPYGDGRASERIHTILKRVL